MKEKGFTIVELMVVIAIIVILPMIVISTFPQIKLKFALSRVAYKFAQDLRRAQDKALFSVQYIDQFGTPQLVDGYGVYLNLSTLGNKKYIIYADKQPGNAEYDALDYIFETIDFSLDEPGVVIKELGGTFSDWMSINFKPPDSDTNIVHQFGKFQPSMAVVFALESDLTSTKTVSINSAGLVEVQ